MCAVHGVVAKSSKSHRGVLRASVAGEEPLIAVGGTHDETPKPHRGTTRSFAIGPEAILLNLKGQGAHLGAQCGS